MRAGYGTILNFTLKFNDMNMSDFFQNIVYPAFFSNFKRSHGKRTHYLLLNPQYLNFGTEEKTDNAIIGRFVKNTVLTSDQILKAGELIESNESIQSSPSSTFALFINDHKLLYLADTPYAPDYKTFQVTILKFIKKSRMAAIELEYIRLKNIGKPLTKKSLERAFPVPSLNIFPKPTDTSIDKFVSQFEILQSIKLNLNKSNHEPEMDDTIKGLKHIADLLDGRTTLSSVNNEGLNKATAEEFLRESVQLDVDEIDARGIGNDGEKLKLDNDDLLIEVDVGTDLPTTVSKVQAMLARLQNVRNK